MRIDWSNTDAFIEAQFPVSKLSKESYKERKANHGQTLTGLGKWWGRKPLVLVRASILGLLLPATDDPKKDREVFLKLMTMDRDGVARRKSKAIPLKEVWDRLTERERTEFFGPEADPARPRLKAGTDRDLVQRVAFEKMTYDEKLAYCDRPEEVEGPSEAAWAEINAHLGTGARNLPELVRELGMRRFGHTPRVGDAFCGGGSIPFEAARIGCDAYGSDLNPVATLLTWAAIHIVGGGPDVATRVRAAQQRVFDAVDRQVTEWGIEHDEQGRRADAYLYCAEVVCPECGWKVPLAGSWVIGEKTKAIARLEPDTAGRRFRIRVLSGVSDAEMAEAKGAGTVKSSRLCCPNPQCGQTTPMTALRGDRRGTGEYGLRMWENGDLVPRPDDVYQERLYCIRWVAGDGAREYAEPTATDLRREEKALDLLRERFCKWQEKGIIPNRKIEPGPKTDEPIRTRGWTHWHHLFSPRQLLLNGLVQEYAAFDSGDLHVATAGLLGAQRLADWNSRLSPWSATVGKELINQVFANQALNTLANHGARGVADLPSVFMLRLPNRLTTGTSSVVSSDARSVNQTCDCWITDPPYADAINYHELSEHFLAWYAERIPELFVGWHSDSKRALAVTGSDQTFRQSMVACYKNLAAHMSDNGLQVVMFTHQDARVWADLALILWAAGLKVTAAWCIATETDSALKEGNYVQGTVLLVLRKQSSNETAFLDEVFPRIEDEVKDQTRRMLDLDDAGDPNFGDSDYQLAAYAAALRVLTSYRGIGDLDVARELAKVRGPGETSPLEDVIRKAVEIACDFLVPRGFDSRLWKRLGPDERFYLRGLEVETHGEYRSGVYQELARGFRVREYKPLLADTKANQTRLKTASEFGNRDLAGEGFGGSTLRAVLFAVREASRTEDVRSGLRWLKDELPDYWGKRELVLVLLDHLARLDFHERMPHWKADAEAARVLGGTVQNDSV